MISQTVQTCLLRFIDDEIHQQRDYFILSYTQERGIETYPRTSEAETSLQQSEIRTRGDSRGHSEPLRPFPFPQEPDVRLRVRVRTRVDQELHAALGQVGDQAGDEDQEDQHPPRHVPDWTLRGESIVL